MMTLSGQFPKVRYLEKQKFKKCSKGNFYCLYRILYVWHIRHPSSGYVQGLNDIVTPFLIVFLSEHVEIKMKNIDVASELNKIKPEILKNV